MNELKITLKQHTPLIHFQHDQEGATLRASEVKPKLDKFIKEKLNRLRPDLYTQCPVVIEDIPAENNKISFPYKLSIRLKDEKTIDKYVIGSFIPRYKIDDYRRQGFKILDKTPYFADNKPIKDGLEKSEENYKLGLMLKDSNRLELVFRFWDTRWNDFLREVLPLFFVSNNFGTRQNKGFGCFLPDNINQRDMENYLSCFSNNALYRSSRTFDMENAFSEVDKIYKTLKSGNQRTESELRKYFNNKRPMIEWEKPAIQEEIASITGQRLRINSKTNNRQFVRAVLGLPELYEYPKNKMKVQVKYLNETNDDKDKIERYASPLSFKIVDGYIYLYVFQEESAITGKPFKFEFNGNGIIDKEKKLSLNTPEKFDVVEFLNGAMKYQKQWIKL
jgi:hypothetical protein